MVHTNFQHFKVRNSQELKEYSYVLQALLFTGAPVTGAHIVVTGAHITAALFAGASITGALITSAFNVPGTPVTKY